MFIKDDTLYQHTLLKIDYTTYDLKRDSDTVHLDYGNQAVIVYSPTSQDAEPWLYAYIVAVYHVFVYTMADPEPKRLEVLWVRWMERGSTQLTGSNSSQYTRLSFTRHSGIPGDAFGFVDPSHVVRGCHLIPAFHLQRTHDRLGPSIVRDIKGDWRAFYVNRYTFSHLHFPQLCLRLLHMYRFVNRDAFARFSGIGIGCQRFQATRSLEITVGADAPDPMEPATTDPTEQAVTEFDESLFDGCYKIDDEEEVDP